MTVATSRDITDLVVDLLPEQGEWSEEAYLWLTDSARRLVEFDDGTIEVLPVPMRDHQLVVRRMLDLFAAHVEPKGLAIFSPIRLRIRPGKFREPDLLVLKSADDPRSQNRFFTGADLVVEVVSPNDPNRDLVDKRSDYAEAGVPEYWIVNPLDETVTVLVLGKKKYRRHGVFAVGEKATSVFFPTASIEVASVFPK